MELGTKGVQYASRVIMQTAINGGGGLMNTLRKSYSVGDVTDGRAITNSQRSGVVLHELDDNQQQLRGRQLTPLQDVSDSEFEEIGEDLEGIYHISFILTKSSLSYIFFILSRNFDETSYSTGSSFPGWDPRGVF